MAGKVNGHNGSTPDPTTRTTAAPVGEAPWRDDMAAQREHNASEPESFGGRTFADLERAYRYGFDAARGTHERHWAAAMPAVRKGWEELQRESSAPLAWEDARSAVRHAWTGVVRRQREQERRRASRHGDAMLLV